MMRSHNVELSISTPSTPAAGVVPLGALLCRGFNSTDERSVSGHSNIGTKSLLNSSKSSSAPECVLEEGTLPKVLSGSLPPPPPAHLAKKVGAEFIGTFILIFAGTATAIVNQKTQGSETLLGLAASAGLAIMIVILSTGHISGAHVNPAITIAFASLKHFSWKLVPLYVGAQAMGSISAAFSLRVLFHPIMGGGVTVPSGGYLQAFALEFIVTFILMFVVTAVATDTRAESKLAAIAVGGTVMLNVLIAGSTTGASMNPVRTLGPAIAANNYKAIWVYLTAPVLGALCGAATYTAIKQPEEDGDIKTRLHPYQGAFVRS